MNTILDSLNFTISYKNIKIIILFCVITSYVSITMVIRRKSSIYKKLYELNGQSSMFGYDNLKFKTVNLPKSQKFKHLCPTFSLKKFHKIKSINIPLIIIN